MPTTNIKRAPDGWEIDMEIVKKKFKQQYKDDMEVGSAFFRDVVTSAFKLDNGKDLPVGIKIKSINFQSENMSSDP